LNVGVTEVMCCLSSKSCSLGGLFGGMTDSKFRLHPFHLDYRALCEETPASFERIRKIALFFNQNPTENHKIR
jgi:hypothetical protein